MGFYKVVPARALDRATADAYWAALLEPRAASLLRARLCDVKDPGPAHVGQMRLDFMDKMYYIQEVVDESARGEAGAVVGEFVLDHILGGMYACHFSFIPRQISPAEKLKAGRYACVNALLNWPQVYTLVGLLPVQNKRAIKFAEQVGFYNVGILPGAQYYRGELTDARMLILAREAIHGWK